MTHFMVAVVDGSLTVAGDVPADRQCVPPWRVVSAEELQTLRDKYETNPVPHSITARQIRLWLVQHGVSMAQIEAAIDDIPDAGQRESVRVEWEYAPYIERSHPWLVPLATALGLNEAAVDAAFREAASL